MLVLEADGLHETVGVELVGVALDVGEQEDEEDEEDEAKDFLEDSPHAQLHLALLLPVFDVHLKPSSKHYLYKAIYLHVPRCIDTSEEQY